MKSTQVKSHKRKGRVVKSHSRSVKGAKTSGAGMSAEECKAKYDAMVTKYGEDSPQAKKLAMKMEGMETVEKDSRRPVGSKQPAKNRGASDKPVTKRGAKNPINKGYDKADMLEAVKKRKHSRGDYMRKNVEEELLTKEAKMRSARNLAARKTLANSKKKDKTITDYKRALTKGNTKIK